MNEKAKNTQYVNIALGLLLIALLYTILSVLKIGCPIKFLTGVSCAGCEMTRAWACLLRGEIVQAFCYHPLLLLPVIWTVTFFIRDKLSKKSVNRLIIISTFLFLLVYFIRLYSPDCKTIQIDITQGFLWRVFQI